jgi:hypothetical protein
MRRKPRWRLVGPLLLAGALALWLAWPRRCHKVLHPLQVQDGDLVFVSGTSLRGSLVRWFDANSSEHSHVGLLRVDRGTVSILHVDPQRNAVSEPFEALIASGRISDFSTYRIQGLAPTTAARAVKAAEALVALKVPFDGGFRNQDHASVYCTEWVWLAYHEAGMDVLPGFEQRPGAVYPSELLACPGLVRIQ